jgi:outer membrane protein assembly factor BamB
VPPVKGSASDLARAALASLLLALAASCGGGQTHLNLFSTDWTDDGGVSIDGVWRRVGSERAPAAADVAVGVAGNSDKIVGLALATGTKWTFAHPVDARPAIAGGVVVGSGGGEVFALDASSGSKLWARPTGGLALLGAGDDGTVTVLTFKQATGLGSTLLAIARDGSSVREIETDKALGVPAVVKRLAFVPWGDQYVSVIDLANGDEAARVTLREKVSRAWTQGGSLWFGEVGFFRFDARTKDASKNGATHAGIPSRELPGTPKLMFGGTQRLLPVANAEDKTRMYARPGGADAGALPSGAAGDRVLGVEDAHFYGSYFKIAMGFESSKGQLAWVHTHASDIIAGAAGAGSLVLCDDQGKVIELYAKNGAVLGELDVGEPLKSCVVNVDAFRASGPPKDVRPLATQLSEAIELNDLTLTTAQKLLLRELAAVDDEEATKTLVDVASDPRTSPDLIGDARTALANRRNGARFMETALERHYDHMKDVLRAPPVGPMAQALAAMKEKPAAPLLAAHLLDPADTADDVKLTAAALAALGGPAELATMRQFFGMYRASAEDEDVAAAVVSIGEALMALDGKAGRAMVDAAIKDAMTAPYVKERLDAIAKAHDHASERVQ